MPTYTAMERGYSNLWDRSSVDRTAEAKKIAQTIFKNKAQYKDIGAQVNGMPYWSIGARHYRESNNNFACHLHEGSPLSDRTKFVPKGRPVTGNPPFTFRDSAKDALTMPPHQEQLVPRWSVERTLYEDEKYNGWGYIGKGNSPYVWSGTTIYAGGKYVRDHVFDASVADKQIGTAAIYKELAALDPEVAAGLKDREAGAPKDVVNEQLQKQTEKEKRIGAGGALTSGSSTVAQGTTEASNPTLGIVKGMVLPLMIGVGLALVVIAILSYIKKRKSVPEMVQAKWSAVVPEVASQGVIEQAPPKKTRKRKGKALPGTAKKKTVAKVEA